VASEITEPPASFTVVIKLAVSAIDEKVSEVGDTSRVAATCETVTSAAAVADPEVAVIVAVPLPIAVTRPVVETDATNASDEDHVTGASSTTTPPMVTVAESCEVSENDEKLKLELDSSINSWVCETVTSTVAVADPELAVIVAEPSPTAVINPVDETVAIPSSDEDQSIVTSAISLPPASVAVAVTVSVSPIAPSVRESRESSRVAAACATVIAAVALAEPEVAVTFAVPFVTAVTRPLDETVATDPADVVHDTLAPLIVAPFWSLTVADSCWV